MNFNWYLLVSQVRRLATWPRRRREARMLEAANMAARRSLLRMQDRGVIEPEVNLLARDLPFLHAEMVNGQPDVTIYVAVEVTPELAQQRRGNESLN